MTLNSSMLAIQKLPPWWNRVRLVSAKPPGHGPRDAMTETIECFYHALKSLNCHVDIASNEFALDGINILFFSFFIPNVKSIPSNTIIFNAEQITDESLMLTPAFFEQVAIFTVWDYSARNISRLRQTLPKAQLEQITLGHMSEMTRIVPAPARDIDIFFYGAPNERRLAILNELCERGCNVVFSNNVYGPERDALIARSKIVLNIHFYSSKIFELVRVSYLLSNKQLVVSECDDDTEIDPDLRDAMVCVRYEDIVETCISLLGDPQRRAQIAENGYSLIKARDQAAILSSAIHNSSYLPPLPTKLNVGSGKSWREDCLNIDINHKSKPDLLADAAHPDFLKRTYDTTRFGNRSIEQNYFEIVIAMDVLEHIPDLPTFMTNCLAILKDGGEMHIGVPYDLSYGAWQDPTHVRAFNEKSWLYYTEWFWYLGWDESRFDMTKLECVLSEYGRELSAKGMPLQDLMRIPRAVDSMNVILRKRPLTMEEREQGKQNHSQTR